MSLSVGIVGLPNVGKSTLFNALLKRQMALAANYPFATIEPNVGVVEVPDERLEKLGRIVKQSEGLNKLPPLIPAVITFIDIAGLVKGAHKGEGLGNKFLGKIKEVDLICHVLRAFEDKDVVVTGKLDPVEDLKTVRMELILKDVEIIENQLEKTRGPLEKDKVMMLEKILKFLNKGRMINSIELDEKEKDLAKELCLITAKQEIFVVNLSESQLKISASLDYSKKLGVTGEDLVYINAKLEVELGVLSIKDQVKYLKDLGIDESGINKMARLAYTKLDLISFLTAGEIEVRAWTIKKGMMAKEASGVIHTDFVKNFIKAQVINYDDYVKYRGTKKCRDLGKIRIEGGDYIIKDGDVIEFMIGS
ncbi:MAG: redox-regulated ATPase YchF [Patescibacteria group bacterium]|nr:redox-regulated ATPase YchF [Patescibacteria group bacterium]